MTVRKYQQAGLLCIGTMLIIGMCGCTPSVKEVAQENTSSKELVVEGESTQVEKEVVKEVFKEIKVKSKTMNEETDAYIVEIDIPVISGFENKEFEETMNAEIDKSASDYVNLIKTMAIEIEEEGYLTSPYFAGVAYNVLRNDEKYLSLEIIYNEYTGGAHGNYFTDYINYDLAEEKSLSLGEIMKRDVDYMTVLEEAIAEAIADKRTSSEYGDALHSWYEGLEEETLSFSIQTEGLGIHFQPYEIGPYAEGAPSFVIPYERLADVILIEK